MNSWLHSSRSPVFPALLWLGVSLQTLPSSGQQAAPPTVATPTTETNVIDEARPGETPPNVEEVTDEGGQKTFEQEVRKHIKRATTEAAKSFSGMRFGLSGPAVNRLLVIPGEATNSSPLSQTRAELAIMSRILTKAVNPDSVSRGNFRFSFRGFDWGDHRELDALYLSGYGAIFLLDVNFPLVPPPVQAAAPRNDYGVPDSDWENARRELSGGDSAEEQLMAGPTGGRLLSEADKYQADRVKRLTEQLINALKHANNIKTLSPTEKIVVQVHGQGYHDSGARREMASPQSFGFISGVGGSSPSSPTFGAAGNPFGSGKAGLMAMDPTASPVEMGSLLNSGSSYSGTTMTLEVRQSDVQDFAKGRITREAFAKEVRIKSRDDSRDNK